MPGARSGIRTLDSATLAFAVVKRTADKDPYANAPPRRHGAIALRVCFAVISTAAVILGHAFIEPPLPVAALRHLALLSFLACLGAAWFVPTRIDSEPRRWRVGAFLAVAGGLAGVLGATQVAPGAWRIFEISLLLLLVAEWWRLNLALARRLAAPVLLVPFNFLALIAVGTLVLKAPEALRVVTDSPEALRDPIGGRLRWLDAFFTMTSAVCLTGLTVRDIAHFSAFGQTAIVLFVQLGGLATAVVGSIVVLHWEPSGAEVDRRTPHFLFHGVAVRRIVSLVTFIVTVMVACELIGALIMMPMWPRPMPWSTRLAASLFQSISAFCNSGFALPMDSLQSYRHSMLAHLVVAPLAVIGAVGFPVIRDLCRWARVRCALRGPRGALGAGQSGGLPGARSLKLSPHSRMVLTMTFAIYLVGTATYAAAHLMAAVQAGVMVTGTTDGHHNSTPLSWQGAGAALADASFMSLSARSAGFTTVPTDGIEPVAELVLMTQMAVGASPGGTGGGLTTTAAGLLLLAAAATLAKRRGDSRIRLPIAGRLLRVAATVAVCFATLIAVTTALLCVSESVPFRKLLFESVSAASAAGLSLGITAQLTPFGKAVIIAAMFLGRVALPMIALVLMCGPNAEGEPHAGDQVLGE